MKKSAYMYAFIITFSFFGLAPKAYSQEYVIEDWLEASIKSEMKANPATSFNNKLHGACRTIYLPILGASRASSLCRSLISKGNYTLDFDGVQLLESGTVDYSLPVPSENPETIEFSKYSVKNCTSLSRNINEEITVTTTESTKITTQTKIISKKNAEIKAELKLSDAFTIGGSASVEQTVEFTESEEYVLSNTNTFKTTINEAIPSYSALLLTMEKTYTNSYFDFEGYFDVDATIKYMGIKVGKVSEFFELEIPVKGRIWNSEYRSIYKDYLEIPLPTSPNECANFDLRLFGF